MSCKLYTFEKIDFTKEKMFFGEGKNTLRFDVMKYSWYDKNNNSQQGNDWTWDEVTIKQDIVDFKHKIIESEKFVITRQLQKAIFLDSLNGRGPILMFGQVCNLPEVEAAILTWEHFETNKHARTYTKHLRAFYDNPDEIFDESFNIPELMKVAKSIEGPYEECYKEVIGWIYKQQRNIHMTQEEMKKLYEAFIMAWIEVNALEGIRFYPFFASIWALKEGQGLMKDLSEDLVFICRDEGEHLNLTQHTLKILKTNLSEGFSQTFKELIPRIKERYYKVYREECEWIDYTFSKGSFPGLNAKILKQYVNYLTIRRMRAIGLVAEESELGELVLENPIPWVESFINNDDEEKLPQQEMITNYTTGSVIDDVENHQELDCMDLIDLKVYHE